jgi:hypothetical protein
VAYTDAYAYVNAYSVANSFAYCVTYSYGKSDRISHPNLITHCVAYCITIANADVYN